MPYRPDGLGSMNIFTPEMLRTKSISIESRDGTLGLIKTSVRGAPLEQAKHGKRVIRNYETVRIAKGDRILASELAFVRDFAEEQKVMELQKELAKRLGGGDGSNGYGLLDDVELTLEHMRLGAVQGKFLDSDGSILVDWTNEFDGTGALVDVPFNMAATDGSFEQQCIQLTRSVMVQSKGAWRGNSMIHALCGNGFYDAIRKIPEVRETYKNQMLAHQVPGAAPFTKFTYGGIVWDNYRGTDDGSTVAIADEECALFPINTPGVFVEAFSPGERFEHIGQSAKRIYPEIVRDIQRDSYVDLDVYSYPLYLCTRPNMLRSGSIA
jgi:hypothetical protein